MQFVSLSPNREESKSLDPYVILVVNVSDARNAHNVVPFFSPSLSMCVTVCVSEGSHVKSGRGSGDGEACDHLLHSIGLFPAVCLFH